MAGRRRHGTVSGAEPDHKQPGNYFRTGNADDKFNRIDTYVWRRLHNFLVKRKGRNLRPGDAPQWDRDFFHRLGLHRLRGTVQYPEAA